ncbi:hypothetical protein IVA80_22540 [Bradyrhizobium sp. 139]|uniref:hypothetical protein n=1 Tax=Bradyrhizobium sp. 139 TaxID=2782616 RepID=UPI001FF8FB85|nr:hypothetical protein [Bradyrhizobium sp. 139]MCK1743547.1 hypothetical protein [Bradyrhizobium sp. 139]
MTSMKQIAANRRNARSSTGPVTEDGKKRSRRNAIRHGLTAETVIGALEDAEDYATFEVAVIADYDAQSATERELALRLASVLWRLRRATAIESGLFGSQARQLLRFGGLRRASAPIDELENASPAGTTGPLSFDEGVDVWAETSRETEPRHSDDYLTASFVGLASLPTCPLDRLSRYEARLWRQACQILFTLQYLGRRRPWERGRRASFPSNL